MHLIFECQGIDATETNILALLGLLHNEEEGYALASVNYLMYMTKWSESTVKRRLRSLKKKGLIERTLRKEDPTISRATCIFWNKLHERRVKFVPSNDKRSEGEVQNQPANIAGDVAVAAIMDEPTPNTQSAVLTTLTVARS
jgi:DNA-binding PadR family transcriptional regulator